MFGEPSRFLPEYHIPPGEVPPQLLDRNDNLRSTESVKAGFLRRAIVLIPPVTGPAEMALELRFQ